MHDSAVAVQSRICFKPCFSCHDITFDKKQTKSFDVSCSLWRGMYACKKTLVVKALQGFAAFTRRDERQSATSRWGSCRSLVVVWCLGQIMRKLKASNQMDHVQALVAGADPPCVQENIVQFFPDIYLCFHHSQVTPIDFFRLGVVG